MCLFYFSEITSNGKACSDECHNTPGSSHYWCNTQGGGVGYCTPQHFLDKLSSGNIIDYEEDEEDIVLFDTSLINPRGGTADINFGVHQDQEGPESGNGEGEDQPEVDQDVLEELIGSLDARDIVATLSPDGSRSEATEPSTTARPFAVEIVASAKAYTAFGEPCRDACARHDDEDYTWCHKIEESNVGTWADSDYCSVAPDVTSHGEECVDACEQRGYDYYWCHKDSTLWGYCTPEHLIIE